MTDKQRNLIMYLDKCCEEKGLSIRATDEELLGKEWWKTYRNTTISYAIEVINKLKMALGMPLTTKARGKR